MLHFCYGLMQVLTYLVLFLKPLLIQMKVNLIGFFFLYRKLFSFLVDKDGTLYKEISFGYSDIVSDYIVSVTPYREGDRIRSETKIRTITGLKSFERILEGYSLAYVGVTIERLRECLNDFGILDKVESIMGGL